MNGQYLQYADTAPTVRLFAYDNTGAPVTSLVFNTSGLTISYVRGMTTTALTLVTATLGTWVSSGFVHRGAGIYDLYLPVAANASGQSMVTVFCATPANVFINPAVVAIGPDALTTAAATDASVATAVDAIVADNFTAIPGAVRTNLATELSRLDAAVSGAVSASTLTSQITALRQSLSVGAKFGAAVSGGSAAVVPVYDAGNSAVLLGTVTIYRDSSGAVVGQSALTPP